MQSLKRISLNGVEPRELATNLHMSNDVILEFNSVQDFRTNFSKCSSVLFDFKDKIKAINSISQGNIFEGNVIIISELEDKLNIPIPTLFIKSSLEKEINFLAEIYFDDMNDGSFELNILNTQFKNPINIIEWILLSNINCGINLSIDMDIINPVWLNTPEIFNSIYPYLNSFVYKEYIQVIK